MKRLISATLLLCAGFFAAAQHPILPETGKPVILVLVPATSLSHQTDERPVLLAGTVLNESSAPCHCNIQATPATPGYVLIGAYIAADAKHNAAKHRKCRRCRYEYE